MSRPPRWLPPFLLPAVLVAGCSDKPAPPTTWSSSPQPYREAATLEVTGPTYASSGSEFDLKIVLTVPGRAGEHLSVKDKMFFVLGDATCEVTQIGGAPPRRLSEVADDMELGRGQPGQDPYVPATDEIVLGADGRYETTARVLVGAYDERALASIGGGAYGCAMEVWSSDWARTEPKIEVRK